MPEPIKYFGSRPKAEAAREYNRTRARREADRFLWSAAWKSARLAKLNDQPRCERCEADGLVVLATHVHHRIPRDERPDLALDLDNLECLCVSCHTRHHNEERGRNA